VDHLDTTRSEGILRAAEALGVSAIMIGVTQRSSIYHLLRGTCSPV